MIKLFAFDLDGTILNNQSHIEKETINAIKKLDYNGIKFVLASGRVSTSVEYIMKKIDIDNPFIANNGAISFLKKGIILSKNQLETQQIERLIYFANKRDLYYHFYDYDTFYSQYLIEERLKHLEKAEDDYYKYQVNISISENPLKQLEKNNTKVLKFQIFINEKSREKKEKLIKELKKEFKDELYITSSADHLIEIMNKNVSKWNAILDISKSLGINKDEIAAIGDQDNDYLMIEKSKIGFAMGNATESLKEIADFIVKSNQEYGAVEAIEKVLEINRNV